jgi:opine dehydrogenase
MKTAVCGSGPGAMAIAAHLADAGRPTTIVDRPDFATNVAAISSRGGVEARSGWWGTRVTPVEATHDVIGTVTQADLVVISVPASVHETWVADVAPALRASATLLFMGEGSGSLVARRVLLEADRPDLLVGETNCLPLIARAAGPGAVVGEKKTGGVLIAAIPSPRTEELLGLVSDVWPFLETASSVFETALVNYDAIDIVPVALTNVATIEGRRGGMLLWGEGATPSVVRLIEALDAELFELRHALGGTDPRRYRDFLIAQGLAPDVGDLHAVMRAGGITRSVRPSGTPEDLVARLELEVPCSLVLASSIGEAVGLATPVIDGLIDIAAAMLGRDVRAEGRTLATVGLGGLDAGRLRAYAAGDPLPG